MRTATTMTSLLLSMSCNLKLLFLLLICNVMLDVECGRRPHDLLSPHRDVFKPQDSLAEVAPRRTAPDGKCIQDHCDVLLIKKLASTVILNAERVMMEAEENYMEINSGKGSGAVGSKPPSCVSKCGSCKPCTPVRVPVQPGTPNTSEYYPEAWRCKCGGKLYMP